MPLKKAQRFLEDVVVQKQSVPFTRFSGGVGRNAQSKQWGVPQSRWPKKSAEFLLNLLKNAEANAEVNSFGRLIQMFKCCFFLFLFFKIIYFKIIPLHS